MRSIVISLAMSLCVTATSLAAMPGDINGDGRVTIDEVQLVISSYLGLYVPPPAAVLGDIQIVSIGPFEIFRSASAVTYGVKLTAKNTGKARANTTITFQAKAPDDTKLLDYSLNWAIDPDPVNISPMQITSFTLPPAQYDSAKWAVTSIVLN